MQRQIRGPINNLLRRLKAFKTSINQAARRASSRKAKTINRWPIKHQIKLNNQSEMIEMMIKK